MQKIALSHELFEGIATGDIPTPIKKLLPSLVEAENRSLKQFADVKGIDYNLYHCDEFKEVDKAFCVMEAKVILPSNYDWGEFKPLYHNFEYALYKLGSSESEIKKDFLEAWYSIF